MKLVFQEQDWTPLIYGVRIRIGLGKDISFRRVESKVQVSQTTI